MESNQHLYEYFRQKNAESFYLFTFSHRVSLRTFIATTNATVSFLGLQIICIAIVCISST